MPCSLVIGWGPWKSCPTTVSSYPSPLDHYLQPVLCPISLLSSPTLTSSSQSPGSEPFLTLALASSTPPSSLCSSNDSKQVTGPLISHGRECWVSTSHLQSHSCSLSISPSTDCSLLPRPDLGKVGEDYPDLKTFCAPSPQAFVRSDMGWPSLCISAIFRLTLKR